MISELQKLIEETDKTFRHLSNEQLNWKPSAESWSIGQCFDHLVVTNKLELPVIEKALQGEHNKTILEKLPLLPKFIGYIVIKFVNPENTRKNKAPKSFRPSQSDISLEILNKYQRLANKTIELIKESEGLETGKMIITSPISRFATFSVLDAFKIIILHDQRHFNQAKRVLETEGFPK